MAVTGQDTLADRLTTHLRQWLGSWPPAGTFEVVPATQRQTPGWDGGVHPAIGIADADGRAVLSVPPDAADTVREYGDRHGWNATMIRLPILLGLPARSTYRAVFRWTTRPARLADVGSWVPASLPAVPGWLRPFGGDVLVATGDDGDHLGGVGVKRHDDHANELSVVVAPTARGRGLGTALVAQAARRVLAEGRLPTYLHSVDNPASARLADAAGFPDQGWTSFGISEATPERDEAVA